MNPLIVTFSRANNDSGSPNGEWAEEDRVKVEGAAAEGITRNQIIMASAVLLIASVIFVRYSFAKTA